MSLFLIAIFIVVLFILEVIYFKIADKFNIIDKPNHRSSHTKITIRGGGIIFPLSILVIQPVYGVQYPYFILALFLISLISFADDIKHVSNKLRIFIHLFSVILLFYQIGLYNIPYYLTFLAFIFVIGTINAINFMDGINGITGLYALLTISTLYYINNYITHFVDNKYLIIVIISLLVFNFFNFRIKAKCFAGDVGSVSIAFIIVFFLLLLIIKTGNLSYLLLLLLYGLDTVTTIFFRLLRKENVFEPHRTHFYQFLANEKCISHIVVSGIYTMVQGLINILIVHFSNLSIIPMLIILCVATVFFISTRLSLEGSKKLCTLNSH